MRGERFWDRDRWPPTEPDEDERVRLSAGLKRSTREVVMLALLLFFALSALALLVGQLLAMKSASSSASPGEAPVGTGAPAVDGGTAAPPPPGSIVAQVEPSDGGLGPGLPGPTDGGSGAPGTVRAGGEGRDGGAPSPPAPAPETLARGPGERAEPLQVTPTRDGKAVLISRAQGDSQAARYDRWMQQGRALRGRGAPFRALLAFERASDLRPKSPGPIFSMGLCYLDLGKLEAAEIQFHRALRADPSYLPARHALALMADGEAVGREGS